MVYKIGSVEVVQRPAISLDSQFARYSPHKPSTTLLPKGFQKAKELLPFKASTIFEKDVTITLRDGTKLFADIFRPEGDAKVPVILCWSPYGKTGTGESAFCYESSICRLTCPRFLYSRYHPEARGHSAELELRL